MSKYFIFAHNKYDPNAYHFMDSPICDEVYPVFDWGTGDFLIIEASTPGMALAHFWSYQNENVSPLGESDWIAVDAEACTFAHYDPPKSDGTQYVEVESNV